VRRWIAGQTASGFRPVKGDLPAPVAPITVTWEPVGSGLPSSPLTHSLGVTGKESDMLGAKTSPVKQAPVYPQAPPIPELTPL
jgi:hypothetical protein